MRPLRIDGFSRVPLLSEVPSKIEIFKHVRDFYGVQNEDLSEVLWETIFFEELLRRCSKFQIKSHWME